MYLKSPGESYHAQNLPHIRAAGKTYHVRFSVAGEALRLSEDWAFAIVEEAVLFRHKRQAILHGYVIMPSHVHVVMQPLPKKGRSQTIPCAGGLVLLREERVCGLFWGKSRLERPADARGAGDPAHTSGSEQSLMRLRRTHGARKRHGSCARGRRPRGRPQDAEDLLPYPRNIPEINILLAKLPPRRMLCI